MRAIPLGIAVVQQLLQLFTLSRGYRYFVESVTVDDTYYYLQAAWSWAHRGWVTFDGLHPTNGFQFLWFLVVSALAVPFADRIQLLYAVLVTCFLCNAFCHLLIWKLFAVVRRPDLGVLVSCLWMSTVMVAPGMSSGMESSLHAAVIWWVSLQLALFAVAVIREGRVRIVWLTIALVFNAWTRIDSALVSAVIYAFCLAWAGVRLRREGRDLRQVGAAVWQSLALVTAGAVIPAAMNWWWGRSLLPISFLTKAADASPEPLLARLAAIPDILGRGFPPSPLVQPWPVLGGIASVTLVIALWRLHRSEPTRPATRTAWLGWLAGASLLGFLYAFVSGALVFTTYLVLVPALAAAELYVHCAHRTEPELQALRAVWHGHLAAFCAYPVAFALSGKTAQAYEAWYQAPSFLFWCLVAAILAWTVDSHLTLRARSGAGRFATVVVSVLILGAALLVSTRFHPPSPIYKARLEAAAWIDEALPRGAIVAAWNAGQLGYFCGRPVVNLDGLANSVDYYRARGRQDFSLPDYLTANRVTHVVDYSVDPQVARLSRLVTYFPTRPDWKPVLVLEYTPTRLQGDPATR